MREDKIQEKVKEIKQRQDDSVIQSVEDYKKIKADRGEEIDPSLGLDEK